MTDPEAIKARLSRFVDKPVTELELRRSLRGRRAIRPAWLLGQRIADALYGPGLDTSKNQTEIDHFHPDRVTYQPSGWRFLSRVLHKRDIGRDEVFVDFGSGKGRVLYRAARYPFKRVVGVEISAALSSIARSNLEQNRRRLRCPEVEIVTTDVADFEIPDDMTVGYFYHPFAGDTFRRVIDRIVESIDRAPRRVRLIYACPAMEDYVLATERFRLERRSRGGPGDHLNRRVCMYVYVPPSESLS